MSEAKPSHCHGGDIQFDYSRIMDQNDALAALAALAQTTRLSVFRLLVTAGHDGIAAGEIADRLNVRPNTLSTHLRLLTHAGLVRPFRSGRVIRYTANYARMRDLMAFLIRDCCAGNPEICTPLVEIAKSCAACASEPEIVT